MKKKENGKKKRGICHNLLVVNRERRKDFLFWGKRGFGSYGNGTPTQAAAIWNHGTDRKHILGSLQLLIYWNGNLSAMPVPELGQRTWTEDIVAVHVTLLRFEAPTGKIWRWSRELCLHI